MYYLLLAVKDNTIDISFMTIQNAKNYNSDSEISHFLFLATGEPLNERYCIVIFKKK